MQSLNGKTFERKESSKTSSSTFWSLSSKALSAEYTTMRSATDLMYALLNSSLFVFKEMSIDYSWFMFILFLFLIK